MNAKPEPDWRQHQEGGLQEEKDRKEDVKAKEILFGYLKDASRKEENAAEVEWSEKTNVPRPCVAVLRRYPAVQRDSSSPTLSSNQRSILILPGATAWRGTFFHPNGGLIARLRQSFDVWTLDWRGTKVITDLWRDCPASTVPVDIAKMSLQAIARQEVPAAVRRISADTHDIALMGHCIGAAVLALAIAEGKLADCALGPKPKAILSTIGLFYRGAVDTWLRANERGDESRVPASEADTWYIDFGVDAGESSITWPTFYQTVYDLWTKTPYPHCEVRFCRRISSIIGSPYRPDDIAYLHDDERNGIGAQFGLLPLSLLDDIAKAVRLGYIDPQLVANGGQRDARSCFSKFDVTLLTGSENQLWHRDSIDRMYEWLKRDPEISVDKRVFDRYGHQDLWWSPRASEPGGVYDYVVSRLGVPSLE